MSAPSVAILHCPWCAYYIEINPRGGHGRSQGNGYDAALMMHAHVEGAHERTWKEFLLKRDHPSAAGLGEQ